MTIEGSGNSITMKEMVLSILTKLDVIESKLDHKADREHVDRIESRVQFLELKNAKEEGISAYKRWFIPIVVSAFVSIVVTGWLIYATLSHGNLVIK